MHHSIMGNQLTKSVPPPSLSLPPLNVYPRARSTTSKPAGQPSQQPVNRTPRSRCCTSLPPLLPSGLTHLNSFTPNVESLSVYKQFYPSDPSTVDIIGIGESVPPPLSSPLTPPLNRLLPPSTRHEFPRYYETFPRRLLHRFVQDGVRDRRDGIGRCYSYSWTSSMDERSYF
jgi:hypothetical protein